MIIHTRLEPSLVAAGAIAALLLVPVSPALAIDGLRFATKASADQEVRDSLEEVVASDGSADGTFRFNRKLSKLIAKVRVQDLNTNVIATHLHCAVAGQNGDVILDLLPTTGVTAGQIVNDEFFNVDLSGAADCEISCGFAVTNIASLRFAAEEDCLYLNVHTEETGGDPDGDPAGEVRGQLLPD